MNGSLPSPSAWDARFPNRARFWKLRSRRLHLPRRPLLMGILNVTPDSFSDGGQFVATQAAVDQALRLAAEGADILDIGGESTRPYADPVDAQTELERVLPVVTALKPHLLIPISIDTSKAIVAREALAAGVEIVNDVTGLAGDPRMVETVSAARAGVCVMHMQGTPQAMQDNPTYDDVVEEVFRYLGQRRDALINAGIEPAQMALDPGIGFGKTNQHNLMLLAHCQRLHELGCPVLVGPSRKGFIGKVIGDKAADRTAGTIGVSLALSNQGVQVLRIHDIAAVRQALLLYEAVGGMDGQPLILELE